MGRRKRRRGGQPGNQNARKHGFYAAHLTKEELENLWKDCHEQNKEPALAILHAKLIFLLRHNPANPRLLRELSRQYYKYLYSRFGHNPAAKAAIRHIVRGFIRSVRNGKVFLPERFEAKP